MDVHRKAALKIKEALAKKVMDTDNRFIITLAGESGSGKTLTSNAMVKAFSEAGIQSVVISQDNYFVLPPFENDGKRKADPAWLGPHKEVDLDLLEQTIVAAKNGAQSIDIHHIDYESGDKTKEAMPLGPVKVVIVEGTYTSLLRNVDARIFIDEDYHDTLKFRKQRNRGNEVNDPFVENILETEHKIIAGHKHLADFVITKEYEVIEK
jgi:uridine kinase